MSELDYIEVPSTTPDLKSEAAQKLQELFPETIQDGKVSFEALQTILGEDLGGQRERFGLFWPGKTEAIRAAQTPSTATLAPDFDESVNWDETQNIFIEGDNLEVLKILQKYYYGKIKLIYIDPPYNTGKDFIYEDDFVDGIKSYLNWSHQADDSGQKLHTNTENEGRYHSNWLNMMYPRLHLARHLLSEDGFIAISIDENEVNNLTLMCDEIFGAHNRLSTHHIQVRYSNKSLNEKKPFQEVVEYILLYARNVELFTPKQPSEPYSLEKFVWEVVESDEYQEEVIGGKLTKIFKKGQYKLIKHKVGRIGLLKETWASGSVVKGNASGKFFESHLKPRRDLDGLGTLYKVEGIGEDGLGFRYFTGANKPDATQGKFLSGVPTERVAELESGSSEKKRPIGNFYDYAGDVGNIRNEGGIPFNSGKKPVRLLKQLLNYRLDDDFLAMDFFAGSSSFAHAVLQLNSEDGGTRRFLQVQLPEVAKDSTFSTISELSRARIRNVFSELDKGQSDSLDLGFRAYKLVDTNFSKWQLKSDSSPEALLDAMGELVDSARDEATQEELLTEVLLKMGFSLTEQTQSFELGGLQVQSVNDGLVLAYLNEHVKPTLDQLRALVAERPAQLVLLEDALKGDDELKTNLVQECRTRDVQLWTV
ncbi:adenine specific DNA methylase Mod [Corynebacterium mustelae]|uniref:Adenine specific DNA methylase Mod n=1 Tax=Corynebacterium mustelae TaxID=571915 RepID=A0A0G3GX25_9CORY|nr:site-specific DNA-methyltransferase [Corynebacterium mustelae]AKK05684.1 adenine specific DNA methylase Mod [Corynebacterium mustelae]